MTYYTLISAFFQEKSNLYGRLFYVYRSVSREKTDWDRSAQIPDRACDTRTGEDDQFTLRYLSVKTASFHDNS